MSTIALLHTEEKQEIALRVLLERNHCNTEHFFNILYNTVLLFMLQQICTAMKKNIAVRNWVKHKYFSQPDNIRTTQEIVLQLCGIQLSEAEATTMNQWIQAHLEKKPYRKPISEKEKQTLLLRQSGRCACCGKEITIHDHYDHIIPWDLVGDELPGNVQMLCASCNQEKNSKVYFTLQRLVVAPLPLNFAG